MNHERPPAPILGDAAILGLDNVRLDLPLAGIGSRTLAALLDYLMLTLLMILWWLGGLIVVGFLEVGGGWTLAILGIGAFLLQWGYFAVLEIAMDGQTPGKLAVGLRVVSHRAGKPSAAAILVRNFVRSIDLAIGLPMMAVDRRARRLGDFIAGTLVVHHRDPSMEEVRLRRLPAGWGAREIAVVESFLGRAAIMETARAWSLATQLLDWIDQQEPDFLAADWKSSPDPILTLRTALAAENE
ncbi:MAG: RDD family protein [bacterium]|nr:RDD family protein [bacterium]